MQNSSKAILNRHDPGPTPQYICKMPPIRHPFKNTNSAYRERKSSLKTSQVIINNIIYPIRFPA